MKYTTMAKGGCINKKREREASIAIIISHGKGVMILVDTGSVMHASAHTAIRYWRTESEDQHSESDSDVKVDRGVHSKYHHNYNIDNIFTMSNYLVTICSLVSSFYTCSGSMMIDGGLVLK